MKKSIFKKIKRIITFIIVVSLLIVNKSFYLLANDVQTSIDSESSDKNDNAILNDKNIYDAGLFGWNGGSDTSGNNRIVSSEFEFASITYSSKEDKSRFYYTDDYFKNDSTIYNNHLSTMSIELALSGVGNYIEEDKDKYANLKDVFSKTGFVNITPNDDFLRHPEENTMGSVCANKHIYLKDAGGNVQDYNLFAVAMRSANYSYEWISNFTIGQTGDHQGFTESRDKVYAHFNAFYNEHKNDFGNIPIKIWIVGYSRGAAIANMLAGRITDECATFNTTKENIYCYSLGTPRGAFISNHTAVPLESYTNIHNIVTEADFIQLLAPPCIGFGRYGVDHKVPTFISDKVHDPTERAAKQASNADYMIKYNKMLSRLRQIDPLMYNEINDLKMYEFTIFDLSTFQYLIFKRLGEEPFTDTSDEREYYQTEEYIGGFFNGVLKYALECSFAGTDYGSITGRDRYYQKYQDIILKLFKIFYLDADSKTTIEKIKENAMDNLLTIISLAFILDALVYCEGMPPDRTDASSALTPNFNAYEKMEPVYEALLNGAVSDADYNFLIGRHRDVTDFLLDLLNADFRATELPKKSAIGTLVKNINSIPIEHMGSIYLSWLQIEDDYFDTPPSDTLKYDGIKTVTFTDLSDSKVEVYNENNDKICEYTIDISKNITCTDFINTEYAHIVKSYNPEGLELRVASDKNYKAIVTSNNKSIGQTIYREYFLDDAEFYRKEINLGNIYLKDYENLEIGFNSSSFSKVYSCYKTEDLNDFKSKTFTQVDNNGVNLSYAYDYYTYATMPSIYKNVKLSAESLKDAAVGDYASFVGTSFEDQNSHLESIDLDSGAQYKKIDLLTDKKAVLHVKNNVNAGYSGVKTYNNYNDVAKSSTETNYNEANVYYVGKGTEYSVLHNLEVTDGAPTTTSSGLFGINVDIATNSDADEIDKALPTNEIETIDETQVTTEIVDKEEVIETFESLETSETSDTLEYIKSEELTEDTSEVTETVEEITIDEEKVAKEEVKTSDENQSENEIELEIESETETEFETENTVKGFAYSDDSDIEIATESEIEQQSSLSSGLFGDGPTSRLYYVSVPCGYAKDISGNEKKYYNTGDTVKIYITTEDIGKQIKSISIFNADTLVETIDNVSLNTAVDYTVSDFDIRVVANYENKKYVVNFNTQGEGKFYYFNGQSFVEGVSGNEYEYGTKIRFTAPFIYDGREFFGWMLKDSNGRYLNQKGVDTPKVIDESSGTNSTYTLELKDFGIDILANYKYKEYRLTLQIDSTKGVASPSDAALVYTNVDDFDNAKNNIDVISITDKKFLSWSDGLANYLKLSDYTWRYNKDVTLTAVFEGSRGGGGGSSSGGGGSGGAGGPMPDTNVPNTTLMNSQLGSTSITIDSMQTTWIFDPVSNKFRLNIDVNGQSVQATNGFYTINSTETQIVNAVPSQVTIRQTYCFDTTGNMVTGWVKTADDKWYFFENAKTIKEGVVVVGWKEVAGAWYYFTSTGSMLINSITPDGYIVGLDGKWIK